jgi:hypothetical protein
MISLRKVLLLITIGAFGFGMAACSKHDAALETDYATKKASAETLVGQINGATAGMKSDHDNWMKILNDAWAKPGADTAKIASLKSDLDKHMADGHAIMALEDSVNLYMNASPDQADAFKNADDRLGTNSNDLSDKWKAFQDAHAKLQSSIAPFAVAAPKVDTVKEVVHESKKTTTESKANNPATEAKAVHPGGVPRKSAK